MPPKCKFTKTEVIQAALEIARSEGVLLSKNQNG